MPQSKYQPAGAAAGSGSRETGAARASALEGAVRRRCNPWWRADGVDLAVVGVELALGAHSPQGAGGRATLDEMRWRRRVLAPAPASGEGGDAPAAGARGAARLGFRPLG